MITRDWLSFGNRKYRKKYGTSLLTFGLPAYKSRSGFMVCPGAKDCIAGCYARQGFYMMSPSRKLQEARLKLTQDTRFVEIISAEIQRRKPKYIRIHDAGDFYSVRYLHHWISIALMNPQVFFFTYSKMLPVIKVAGSLPDNLKIVFSEGGKFDHMINREQDQFSRIFKTVRELRSAGFVNASHEDMKPIKAGVKKLGLVYHGITTRVFSTGGCDAKGSGVQLSNGVRQVQGGKGFRPATAAVVPSVSMRV